MSSVIKDYASRLKRILWRPNERQGMPEPENINSGLFGEGTIYTNCNVQYRQGPKVDRLVVGKRSVIECFIIFEREIGVVEIGDRTFIGSGSRIICGKHITIGSDVLIAWGCTIVDHDSHALKWTERSDDVRAWREGMLNRGGDISARLKNWDNVPMTPINIGDKSWIGFNSIILKGVNIGEGGVVAAGAVVTKNVPPWTVVGGNPARVIRELTPE